MRLAQAALKYDPSFYPAVSLWLAAKMRQEIQGGPPETPAPEGEPGAKFYALAGSAKYLQDVLGRALRDKDSALACGRLRPSPRPPGPKAWSNRSPVACSRWWRP